jgi:hypothetical protein
MLEGMIVRHAACVTQAYIQLYIFPRLIQESRRCVQPDQRWTVVTIEGDEYM